MLLDFLVLLGSATAVATVFHFLRLPLVVGFLSTGILVGPSGLKWLNSPPDVESVAEIAAVLLMFTIGLEFSFKKLAKFKTAFMTMGMTQVVFTCAAAAVISKFAFNFDWSKSIFIGYLVSLSSTAIVLKLIHDHRDSATPHGQTALSILLFQDLAVIPMLMTLPLLAGLDSTGESLQQFSLKILGIVGAVILLSRHVVPFVLDRVARTGSREIFFFCILFICAGSAYGMHALSLSYSLGAFIAGVMISESPYGKQAISDFLPLRDNFLGMFFVSIGMLLDVPFLLGNLVPVVGIAICVILIKIFVLTMVVKFAGHSTSLAKTVSLILFQVGEFSFILVEQGLRLNILTKDESQYFLAAAILSLGLTPFAYRVFSKMGFSDRLMGFLPDSYRSISKEVSEKKLNHVNLAGSPFETSSKSISGHTVIIGFGVAGQNIARALKALKIPYKIIEMNPETVKSFKSREPIFFGDASHGHILEEADILKAKLVILTVAGAEITDRTVAGIIKLRPDIKIIIRAHYLREIKGLHLNEKSELVVGEFETTVEILRRTLVSYGIENQKIAEYVKTAKDHMNSFAEHHALKVDSSLGLPGWDLFSSFGTVKLLEGDFGIGKSIEELQVRNMTGATVIGVYREGVGSIHPGADFVFNNSDIIYFVGGTEQIRLAESYLQKPS